MVFVDSNIPMYLVGATHPTRTRRGGCHGIERILSFDAGFDRVTWIERLGD